MLLFRSLFSRWTQFLQYLSIFSLFSMDSVLEHLVGNSVLCLVVACASFSSSAVSLDEESALAVLCALLAKPLSVVSVLACDTNWAIELVKVSSAWPIGLLLFSMHGWIHVYKATLLCASHAFATEEVSAERIGLFSLTSEAAA